MKTKLDRLLDRIDPSKTLDEVSARVDNAVNRFALAEGSIREYGRFERVLSRFVRHIENEVLRLPGTFKPTSFDWARCSNMLEKEYGRQGHKIAFEMARSGIQGGLYEVLNKIAYHLTEDFARREISARVHHFWNSLPMNKRFAAINEYARKYGHLLPSDFLEGNAVLLKMNFPRVLIEHPRLMKRLRENSWY